MSLLCCLCEEEFEREELESYMGSHYCPECLAKVKEVHPIANYLHKPKAVFYNDNGSISTTTGTYRSGNKKLYMGMELEIDGGRHTNSTASKINKLFDGKFFYCKHDGSLGDYGVEIVTHPATLKCWEDIIPIEAVREIAVSKGFRSHDTDTCGLHVHVNKDFFGDSEVEREENIAKLILIVNRFWEGYLVPFSRRDYGELDQWSRKNSFSKVFSNDKRVYDKLREKGDRYQAINVLNDKTVEFRFFKGSLNTETILASLQLVDRLCRLAKKIKLETLIRIKWSDVVGIKKIPTELSSYLVKRNIAPTTESPDFVDEVVFKPVKIDGLGDFGACVGDMVYVKTLEFLQNNLERNSDGSLGSYCRFTSNMEQYCGRAYKVMHIKQVDGHTIVALGRDEQHVIPYLFDAEFLTEYLTDAI